jgi:hypothetical protein
MRGGAFATDESSKSSSHNRNCDSSRHDVASTRISSFLEIICPRDGSSSPVLVIFCIQHRLFPIGFSFSASFVYVRLSQACFSHQQSGLSSAAHSLPRACGPRAPQHESQPDQSDTVGLLRLLGGGQCTAAAARDAEHEGGHTVSTTVLHFLVHRLEYILKELLILRRDQKRGCRA